MLFGLVIDDDDVLVEVWTAELTSHGFPPVWVGRVPDRVGVASDASMTVAGRERGPFVEIVMRVERATTAAEVDVAHELEVQLRANADRVLAAASRVALVRATRRR